jgi:chromosome segregation ATPase
MLITIILILAISLIASNYNTLRNNLSIYEIQLHESNNELTEKEKMLDEYKNIINGLKEEIEYLKQENERLRTIRAKVTAYSPLIM